MSFSVHSTYNPFLALVNLAMAMGKSFEKSKVHCSLNTLGHLWVQLFKIQEFLLTLNDSNWIIGS